MEVTRSMAMAAELPAVQYSYTARPLQLGARGCSWRTLLASLLLCRARREQAERALRNLLARWPTPGALARAEGLEDALRPCGLQRNRARQMQRLAAKWPTGGWTLLRDLPGVGQYVHDAVAHFCFGHCDVSCSDGVLLQQAATYSSPKVLQVGSGWAVLQPNASWKFDSLPKALELYRRLRYDDVCETAGVHGGAHPALLGRA